MLKTSVNLSRSHWYKEKFLEIFDCNDRKTAKEKMSKWIENASNCGIPQFEKYAYTMQNWISGILNSFSSSYTNGFTEGCNNRIKVLKRNAYGYKDFRRFRNRILDIFSHVLHPIWTNRWVFGDFLAISHPQSLQYVSIPALYRVRLTEKSLVLGCAAVLAVIKFFHNEVAKCGSTGVL